MITTDKLKFHILDNDYNIVETLIIEGKDLPTSPVKRSTTLQYSKTQYINNYHPVIQTYGYTEEDLALKGTFYDTVGNSSKIKGKARTLSNSFSSLVKSNRCVLLENVIRNSAYFRRFGHITNFSEVPDVTYGDSRIDYEIDFTILSEVTPFTNYGEFSSVPLIDVVAISKLNANVELLKQIEFALKTKESFYNNVLKIVNKIRKVIDKVKSFIDDVKNKVSSTREQLRKFQTNIKDIKTGINNLKSEIRLLGKDINKSFTTKNINKLCTINKVHKIIDSVNSLVIQTQRNILRKLRMIKNSKYKVQDGDTWETIAASKLGNYSKWPQLVRMNPNINSLQAGIEITIRQVNN